jgi:hypothetical protein
MVDSKLHDNKIFAVLFRTCAFLLAVWGIISITGMFKNAFNPVILLAYTIQSNILVAVFFGILLVRTIFRICGGGRPLENPYGFFPRLSAFVAMAIFVTMLIYWFILVPVSLQSAGLGRLANLNNLMVHLFTPILMLADYLIFTGRGKLKKYDFLLAAVIPYSYLAEAMTLGLTRTVRYDSLGIHSYYPYIFLDVDRFGPLVILMIAAITLFFFGIMILWQRLDKKIAAKKIAAAKQG